MRACTRVYQGRVVKALTPQLTKHALTAVRNHSYGSIGGTAAGTAIKTWNVLNAFGTIAFAYDSISVVLLEVQVCHLPQVIVIIHIKCCSA